jgi:Abortive infection alpha
MSTPPPPPREDRPTNDDWLRAAPALARLVADAWIRTAEWTLRTSVDTARSVLGMEESPPPAESEEADPGEQEESPQPSGSANGTTESLRARGEELLRRSADVRFEEDAHPAYERMLDEIAPDEARVLRLLYTRGPQAAVDVRSGLPLTSHLVAPGLNMVGAEAGCRYVERVPAYLNNLFRLGLIWFSRETLPDITPYQVLEAQPEVVEALRSGGRTARTVRRSLHLTPFGRDFCEACLPLDVTGEFEPVSRDQPTD